MVRKRQNTISVRHRNTGNILFAYFYTGTSVFI